MRARRSGPLLILAALGALAGASVQAHPPTTGYAVSWVFQTCGARDSAPCPSGQVCEPGRPRPNPGFCRPAAPHCARTDRPVCAEDNNTWPNACVARAAGIRILHEGLCLPRRPAHP